MIVQEKRVREGEIEVKGESEWIELFDVVEVMRVESSSVVGVGVVKSWWWRDWVDGVWSEWKKWGVGERVRGRVEIRELYEGEGVVQLGEWVVEVDVKSERGEVESVESGIWSELVSYAVEREKVRGLVQMRGWRVRYTKMRERRRDELIRESELEVDRVKCMRVIVSEWGGEEIEYDELDVLWSGDVVIQISRDEWSVQMGCGEPREGDVIELSEDGRVMRVGSVKPVKSWMRRVLWWELRLEKWVKSERVREGEGVFAIESARVIEEWRGEEGVRRELEEGVVVQGEEDWGREWIDEVWMREGVESERIVEKGVLVSESQYRVESEGVRVKYRGEWRGEWWIGVRWERVRGVESGVVKLLGVQWEWEREGEGVKIVKMRVGSEEKSCGVSGERFILVIKSEGERVVVRVRDSVSGEVRVEWSVEESVSGELQIESVGVYMGIRGVKRSLEREEEMRVMKKLLPNEEVEFVENHYPPLYENWGTKLREER